jgi:hypothetical protein
MGTYGRYRLTAFDGDMWVYSQYYDWATWLENCGGRMCMPEFVAMAEKVANDRRKPTRITDDQLNELVHTVTDEIEKLCGSITLDRCGVNDHLAALLNDMGVEVINERH